MATPFIHDNSGNRLGQRLSPQYPLPTTSLDRLKTLQPQLVLMMRIQQLGHFAQIPKF